MNTNFKVIGLTRLGIKPESTADYWLVPSLILCTNTVLVLQSWDGFNLVTGKSVCKNGD